MKKKDLILVGGGGHCNACLDVLALLNLYNVVGIVEKNNYKSDKLHNVSVFKDQDTKKLSRIYRSFLLTIGKIGKSKARETKYNELSNLDIELVSLISPTAYVSTTAEIAKGVNIMHHALININVRIGENTIINSQSLVEHDSSIGSHCHISTGVKINGEVKIGNNTFIGSGTVIHEGITIGNDVIVGAGSIIDRNLPNDTKYY
tara:strand:- start:571 stop:1182 length:612 start_codon:yes stop_codon:yes gene_type:complete